MRYFHVMSVARNGNLSANDKRGYVPAVEAGLVGDYVDGTPYAPCKESLVANMPFRFRKAMERATLWYRESTKQFCATLYGSRGAYLGTVYINRESVE